MRRSKLLSRANIFDPRQPELDFVHGHASPNAAYQVCRSCAQSPAHIGGGTVALTLACGSVFMDVVRWFGGLSSAFTLKKRGRERSIE